MIRKVFFVFIFNMSVVVSMDGYYQPPVESLWGCFLPPPVQEMPPEPHKTAMEAMVDLTNNLGIVILQDHSFSSGNFAFSPYGVASVLVVLYEGARNESARQIQRAVKFPANRDIIRTGFRDIHQHLRSYFSHESYLSGINLNKNASSLTPEYKKILSFYGYDVDLNEPLDEENWPAFTEATKETTTRGITKKPDVNTGTFIHNGNQNITNPKESEEEKLEKTSPLPPQKIPHEKPNRTELNSEEQKETTVSPETTTLTTMINTEQEFQTTQKDEIEEITNASLDNGMLIPQQDDSKTITTEDHFTQDTTISITTETTTEYFEGTTQPTTQAQEKSTYVNGQNEIMSSKETLSDKKFIKNIRGLVDAKAPLWLTEKRKPKTRNKRAFTDYLKNPNLDMSLQLQNGMHGTLITRNADLHRSLPWLLFLMDGAVDTPVPMMMYTNVFPYAYIPRLHSKALEFPLDDIRYKLLILVPVERRGLRQLIYDLANFPLRNVLECLRPTRVKAMIPTFMVEGFVILTSSLQKLGVRDVFDPEKANLSGMSKDPELYVRNVEQSITVVIRNYVEVLDIQTRTMAARHIDYEFGATHPFLYFVLDTTTNIALMAGQILNPLNTRIY